MDELLRVGLYAQRLMRAGVIPYPRLCQRCDSTDVPHEEFAIFVPSPELQVEFWGKVSERPGFITYGLCVACDADDATTPAVEAEFVRRLRAGEVRNERSA